MPDTFYSVDSFLCLDGPAKRAGLKPSLMKVCLTCRDFEFLKLVIAKIAEDELCYWVKTSAKPKNGMYLGRCFFTTKERAGEIWAKYKKHPRLMVTLQDDEFAKPFRERAVSWKDRPSDAVD